MVVSAGVVSAGVVSAGVLSAVVSAEADLAEQQALKQKLENIEMRRLKLSSVDAYAEPLATAAKNLAVQPSSATIIDITKILKSQQEDQPPQ